MATHTTTHHHIGTALIPEGWGRKIGIAAAGLAVAGAVAVASPWSGQSNDPQPASTVGSTAAVERSVLLDGQAFDLAIADVVADALRPSIVDRPADFLAETEAAAAVVVPSTSALLDAEAFEAAVSDAIASIEPSRSALLDAESFDSVVADVVAELDSESALLDAEAFQVAVAQAVESVLGE